MRVFTWQMAEVLAQEHMRRLGFADAMTTGAGADGGIDVSATGAIAQVKHYAAAVGIAEVQRLRGTAHDGREPIFYASNGYSESARTFAENADMALFEMNESFEVFPFTRRASALNDKSVHHIQLALDALRQNFRRLGLLSSHLGEIYRVLDSLLEQGGAGTVETDLPADYLKSTAQLWIEMLESGQLKTLSVAITQGVAQGNASIAEITDAIEQQDLERAAVQIWECIEASGALLEEVEAQFPIPIEEVPI